MTSALVVLLVALLAAAMMARDRVARSAASDVVFVLIFLGLLGYGIWAHGFLAGIGLTVVGALATVVLGVVLERPLAAMFRKPAAPAGNERLREAIAELEKCKDAFIALVEAETRLDAATRQAWSGDAKEMYYGTVMAFEQSSAAAEKPERADNARWALDSAAGRCRQCASELQSLGGDAARQLEVRMNTAFESCRQQISERLERVAKPQATPPAQRIVRVTAEHYELPCSVCGKVSFVVRVGQPSNYDKPGPYLILDGITGAVYPGLNVTLAERALKVLEQDDLPALYAYLKEISTDGLDAYCPDCDAVYCRQHYNAYDTYDEGFYDCTYATCPRGHRRMIAD